MGRHPRAARGRSGRPAHLLARWGGCERGVPRRAGAHELRRRARRRAARRTRRRLRRAGRRPVQRPAAAAQPQETRDRADRTTSGVRAAVRHSRREGRGPSPLAVRRTAGAPRTMGGRSSFSLFRRLAAGVVPELGRAGGHPRRRPRRGDRGADAEARRQRVRRRPAEGALVQVEALAADRRLRADVRAARPRQAILVLLRLHLRLLARDRRRARARRRSARHIPGSQTPS